MNNKIIKALMAGLISLVTITTQCQSHFGDGYEFGQVYAKKERLKDEIDELHTDKEIRNWQESYCCHCNCCEDEEQ